MLLCYEVYIFLKNQLSYKTAMTNDFWTDVRQCEESTSTRHPTPSFCAHITYTAHIIFTTHILYILHTDVSPPQDTPRLHSVRTLYILHTYYICYILTCEHVKKVPRQDAQRLHSVHALHILHTSYVLHTLQIYCILTCENVNQHLDETPNDYIQWRYSSGKRYLYVYLCVCMYVGV